MPKKNPDVTARLSLEYAPQYSEMVTTTQKQVGTIQQCQDYANQPAVQAAATNALNSAKALDLTLTNLTNARALVASLEKQREHDASQLHRDHGVLESSINVASAGKGPAVLAWGAEIATRTPVVPTSDPPANVRFVNTSVSGNVVAKCKADPGAYAYLFQVGTTPANPDAWPAPVQDSKANHAFTGLTVGQKAYVRMAVVRRGVGQGQWSGVVELLVR